MRFALGVLVILISQPVWSANSCLPAATAAQVLWDLDSVSPPGLVVWPLLGLRGDVLRTTHVQLVGELPAPGEVRLKVRFDPAFDGVSLPYNLLAVMVVRDGAVLAWWDFTSSCQGVGISFFPGKEIELPKLKLIGGDGNRLQIMVWGRL